MCVRARVCVSTVVDKSDNRQTGKQSDDDNDTTTMKKCECNFRGQF